MRVYNRYHKNAPQGSVYIGRPGPWGNPFAIGEHGDRAQVISLYRDWIKERLDGSEELVEELRMLSKAPGLLCFCHPRPCHGDVLIEEMKRRKILPISVGDPIQWENSGIYQFTRPAIVTQIFEDPKFGTYILVEGSTTGIPAGEVFYWGGHRDK